MNTQPETTVQTAAGPVSANKTPFMPTLKPGAYSATITSAGVRRNHNNKLHVALHADIGNRIITHEMYMSTPDSMANTAKQLKKAFGIESFKDVPSIIGKPCSLRVEHEEYNGKIQSKVRYVGPDNSTEVDDVDFEALDAAFEEAKPVEADV